MKIFIIFVPVTFLSLFAFPTTTVGEYSTNLEGWPNPSKTNEMMFLNSAHSFSYVNSKIWKCTYSNGSAPAISISNPGSPTPSTPSPPSPSPPTLKTPPPPPTPSPPPPMPKKSPSTIPTLTLPPPTPKKSPSPPSTPTLPPPRPKKSPSPPPSDNQPSTPSNPPPEHHHHHQNRWEHIESCMRKMGPVGMCRWQMEVSFHTRLFRVSNYCCNLVANMKSECDDVAWGFFTDPFFVPLVRYTCHVNC